MYLPPSRYRDSRSWSRHDHIHTWPCMLSIWAYMIMCNHFRPCMTILSLTYGHICSYMIIYDWIWQHKLAYICIYNRILGHMWLYIIMCRRVWFHVRSYMSIYGHISHICKHIRTNMWPYMSMYDLMYDYGCPYKIVYVHTCYHRWSYMFHIWSHTFQIWLNMFHI